MNLLRRRPFEDAPDARPEPSVGPQSVSDTVLFIIDDINYRGGAHVAAVRQMNLLKKNGFSVAVFSSSVPTEDAAKSFPLAEIYYIEDSYSGCVLNEKLSACLWSSRYSWRDKVMKFESLLFAVMGLPYQGFHRYLPDSLQSFFESFNAVCLISENSIFRRMVAYSNVNLKIQLIQTDYEVWKNFCAKNRSYTYHDGEIYSNFSRLLFISRKSLDGFAREFPECASKCILMNNFLPLPKEECHKASDVAPGELARRPMKLVTVARLEPEKDIPRMMRTALALKEGKYSFKWDVYGSGDQIGQLRKDAASMGISDVFELKGFIEQPHRCLMDKDLFILLSHYEGGVPIVILESLCTGIPVFATKVGSIADQVRHMENGLLVEDEEKAITGGLKKLMDSPDILLKLRDNLKSYEYDSTSAENAFLDAFRTPAIPGKIHYCWFGGAAKNKLIEHCIQSWKKFAPGFEIIEWNEKKCDISSCQYASEAYSAKKWAFVSDYFRLKALWEHGGIYLDTDMELKKPLSPYCRGQLSLAFELPYIIHAGIIICDKHNPFIGSLLKEYESEHFCSGMPQTIPEKLTALIRRKYSCFRMDGSIQACRGITLYPANVFTVDMGDGECAAEHHYENSWGENKKETVSFSEKVKLMQHIASAFSSKNKKLRCAAADAVVSIYPFREICKAYAKMLAKELLPVSLYNTLRKLLARILGLRNGKVDHMSRTGKSDF